MSTCIVGAGLSGLATAIKIKHEFPDEDIVVLYQNASQSNTQIAGQRFRAGISNHRQNMKEELLELLARRSDGVVTAEMKQFTDLAERETNFWQNFPDFIHYEDREEWFGPQWAEGHGKSVVDWFMNQAKTLGIRLEKGEARKIIRSGETVSGLIVHKKDDAYSEIEADRYILAGGNIGGKMFVSTNKPIPYSPQELAFDAGFSIVDSTIHMFHPFGKSDKEGNIRNGCFETDKLSGATVYFASPDRKDDLDEETTLQLKKHEVHYEFPQIVERFRKNGSVVRMEIPTKEGMSEEFARVAHHYGHIAIETTDGISVKGANNLYAVGDASGLGYWTNHQERFPGFALLKCITDAGLMTDVLRDTETEGKPIQEREITYPTAELPGAEDRNAYKKIREVNTKFLDQIYLVNDGKYKNRIATNWMNELVAYDGPIRDTPFLGISITSAYAHAQTALGKKEPFQLNQELLVSLRDHAETEKRREGMVGLNAFRMMGKERF